MAKYNKIDLLTIWIYKIVYAELYYCQLDQKQNSSEGKWPYKHPFSITHHGNCRVNEVQVSSKFDTLGHSVFKQRSRTKYGKMSELKRTEKSLDILLLTINADCSPSMGIALALAEEAGFVKHFEDQFVGVFFVRRGNGRCSLLTLGRQKGRELQMETA